MQEFEHEGRRLRSIADFSGYFVGDDGSVWSNWRAGTHQLNSEYLLIQLKVHRRRTPRKRWRLSDYPQVSLYKKGQRSRHTVHRLVLESFVGFCPEGMVARHLDGNERNNQLENLEWNTRSVNQVDRLKHGTMHAKLTPKDVLEIRKERASGTGRSLRKIAGAYGVSRGAIQGIEHRRRWKWL